MISVVRASGSSRVALANLMQLYAYDWSELRALDVGLDGRFLAPSVDVYFEEADHHPLLIEVGGRLAGFALVVARSRLTDTRGVFDMAEFFVLRRFRRQGVGLAAAAATFRRFPGPWEVRQRDENAAATAFWRRAISDFTGGQYQESRREDERWIGVVQTFSSVAQPG